LNRIKDSMTGRQGLSRSRFVFVLLRHSASTFTLANRSGVAVERSGENVERRAQSCTGTASGRESNCWRAGSGCSVSTHTHTHAYIHIYVHTVCFSRFSRWPKTSDKLSARTNTTAGAASGTVGGASSGGTSQRHHHHRKHRSRSTPRYADVEKPKKKKLLSGGSTSLVSIPNTIKLSMLNSGLMSLGKC